MEGYLQQLARLLGVPLDALKSDFQKFRKNRTPAYRKVAPEKENQSDESDRLTIVEEDLLFLLLHDDRLASPLANTLDMSWVDLRPVAGRILAKILSETHAEGTHLTRAQIEDLLEDDDERRTYTVSRSEIDSNEPGLSLAWPVNACMFISSIAQTKEDFVFSQLNGANSDSDKLKKLSQELRSIRHKEPSLLP